MPISMAAATLLGGGLSLAGGLFSNARNIDLSREQMAFQREMANTQYQRAAKDLEKAGLNRILALGSPAAAPAGARPNITSPTAGLASSAKDIGLLKSQADLLREQMEKTRQEKLNVITQRANLDSERAGRDLANLENAMRIDLYEANPQLYKLQQFNAPLATGLAGAKAVIGAGKSALRGIQTGQWW